LKAAFGEGRNWLLVDLHNYSSETVTLPLSRVDAVDISANGDKFAIVGERDGKYGIWVWKRDESAPRLVASAEGRYSDPAFGPEDWIYFSHSSSTGRRHTFGTYAQLYRVRVTGADFEQMSDENGCHYGATFRAGQLVYVHTSCSSQSWVKRQRVRRQAPVDVLISTIGSIAEASVSPDGQLVMYVEDQPDSFVVRELNAGGSPRQRLVLRRSMQRVRPVYGRHGNEILYQHEGKVWVLRDGKSRVIAVLGQRSAL